MAVGSQSIVLVAASKSNITDVWFHCAKIWADKMNCTVFVALVVAMFGIFRTSVITAMRAGCVKANGWPVCTFKGAV